MARRHTLITIADFIGTHLRNRPLADLPAFVSLTVVAKAQALTRACKANLVTGGSQPQYDFVDDVIFMPSPAFYILTRLTRRATTYSAILLHELVHWTGHRRRIGRPFPRQAFDPTYAREELVAELGSALLCHDLAITKRPRLPHARYLNSYLASLPNPAIDLAVALSHANQAAGYLTATARHRLSIM